MDIVVAFAKLSELSALQALRSRHLDSLPASQEALLEVQLPASDGYGVLHDDQTIGYALLRDGAVLEFYVLPEYAVFGQTIFDQLLTATGATRALVKSFDSLFFSSCVDRQRGLRTLGLLVRDYTRRELPPNPALRFTTRSAQLADLAAVSAIEQQVFTDPSRLRFVIEKELMLLFERDDTLLGFGILRPVVPGRTGVDIGIALDKPYRKHGYAPYFLQHLADACLARGLVPIAGCAVENKAVRATGERIGMFALHRLLELRF